MPIQNQSDPIQHESGPNLISIQRQSGANRVPIQFQSIANRCQSNPNLMPIQNQSVPIQRQSGQNLMSIRRRSSTNERSIRRQSNANLANLLPFRCQSGSNPSRSDANRFHSIPTCYRPRANRRQSNADQASTLYKRIPINSQFNTNSVPIHCQSSSDP